MQEALQRARAGRLDAQAPYTALGGIPMLHLPPTPCTDAHTRAQAATAVVTGASVDSISESRAQLDITGSSWVSSEFRDTASVGRMDKATVRGVEAAVATARLETSRLQAALQTGGSVLSQVDTGGRMPPVVGTSVGEHSGNRFVPPDAMGGGDGGGSAAPAGAGHFAALIKLPSQYVLHAVCLIKRFTVFLSFLATNSFR